jgi:hypothetical protein
MLASGGTESKVGTNRDKICSTPPHVDPTPLQGYIKDAKDSHVEIADTMKDYCKEIADKKDFHNKQHLRIQVKG